MIEDLYLELILDHGKRPRNFGRPEGECRHADGHNPLCGDKLRVFLKMEGDRIAEAAFEGTGCAISTASASVMTETIQGKTRAEAEALFQTFHDLLTKDDPPALDDELIRLEAFAGVRQYPIRVKCATLAWHTMRAALEGRADPVKTE